MKPELTGGGSWCGVAVCGGWENNETKLEN